MHSTYMIQKNENDKTKHTPRVTIPLLTHETSAAQLLSPTAGPHGPKFIIKGLPASRWGMRRCPLPADSPRRLP